MGKKIRVAVIGCGGISHNHLDAYQANPDVEIYALCDINEKNLHEKAEKYLQSCPKSTRFPFAPGTPRTRNARSPR